MTFFQKPPVSYSTSPGSLSAFKPAIKSLTLQELPAPFGNATSYLSRGHAGLHHQGPYRRSSEDEAIATKMELDNWYKTDWRLPESKGPLRVFHSIERIPSPFHTNVVGKALQYLEGQEETDL